MQKCTLLRSYYRLQLVISDIIFSQENIEQIIQNVAVLNICR